MLAVYCLFVKEPKLRDIAWQEDIENPVRHQAKLTVESWKLRDVNTTPQQPGDESFESKTENFRDRRAPAERSKFSKSGEAEVFFLPAPIGGNNVLSAGLGLPQGVLRGGRRDIPVHLLDRCAIANRPNPRPIGDLCRLIDDEAALVLRQWQRREDRMGSRGYRGDSRACADYFRLAGLLVFHNDGVGGDSLQACAEPDLDTAFHEKLVREGRKRCRYLRQDTLAALKQDQSQIALRYVVVRAHGLVLKIVHLRNAFDAGKSAAGNGQRQEPHAAFGIAFRFRSVV